MSSDDDGKSIPRRRARMGFMNIRKEDASDSSSKSDVKKTKDMNENERTRLGQELIKIVRDWDFGKFQEMIANPIVPLDYVEPVYLGTILHDVAGYGSMRMYEELLRREDELNYLARDWKGRLASELASSHSDRNNLWEILIEKEVAAAERIGAKVRPRQTIFADGSIDPPAETNRYPAPER